MLRKTVRVLLCGIIFLGMFYSISIKNYPVEAMNAIKWQKMVEWEDGLRDEIGDLEKQFEVEKGKLLTQMDKQQEVMSSNQESLEETENYAQKSLKAKVCSKANRYCWKAKECYSSYRKDYGTAYLKMVKCQELYDSCKELSNQICQMQKKLLLDEFEKEDLEDINEFKLLVDESKKIASLQQEVSGDLKEADKYSKKLFNEYYPYLLKLVTCEAGAEYCPDVDQYYVMNVVENRVENKHYPNSVVGVIFQKGQYAPTWNGSWGRKADKRTRENVKNYLLGNIETGMPKNIVYQAAFAQGDYVWRYVSNRVDQGSYYCGINE